MMIAVTGAYGFIGSRIVVKILNDPKYQSSELITVDNPFVPAKSANRRVMESSRFMDQTRFVDGLQRGEIRPDIIIHMGACSSTTTTDWDFLKRNNLEYSQKLWTWCAENKARFIYASSAATYGDGSQGFDDETDIDKLQPLNLYGRSKHEFDLWVRDQKKGGASGPPQSVGLKFFNVFGPGEAHKGRMASMVYHGYNQIQQSGSVKLFKSHREGYSDGGQLRDFIYVADVVDVIIQLIDRPDVSGLFNLGTGQARSFRELIEAVFLALEREPNIDYIPMPEDIRDKYQYYTQATMTKIARAGIRPPSTSLLAGVKDYVQNHLDNTKEPSGLPLAESMPTSEPAR